MDQDQIAFFLATGRIQARATQQASGVDLSGAATSVVGGSSSARSARSSPTSFRST